EGVAAEDDRDVMVPAHEGATLEVIEPELTFQVFVHPLCPPAFLDDADEPLVTHAARQGREIKLHRLLVVGWPLDHQPDGLAIFDGEAILMGRLDPTQRKPTLERCLAAFSP